MNKSRLAAYLVLGMSLIGATLSTMPAMADSTSNGLFQLSELPAPQYLACNSEAPTAPQGSSALGSGTQVSESQSCGSKTDDAKCGTKADDAKASDAKCGAGSCGAKDSKASDAKCGSGSCGSKDTAKNGDAKCGAGSCGAKSPK